jgi:competence ComEA-like helix-hairpin-helix protein
MFRIAYWSSLVLLLSLACTLATPVPAWGEGVDTGCPTEATTQVNLNTASAQQLETLPRIGPARARAILRARARLGGFRRLSQLLQIKGIGRATLRQLRPYVVLGDLKGEAPARKGGQ